MLRPALWRLTKCFKRLRNFDNQRVAGFGNTLEIPLVRRVNVLPCEWMNSERFTRGPCKRRRPRRRRTSSPGIMATLPERTSPTRHLISSDQACSTPSSGGPSSRLLIRWSMSSPLFFVESASAFSSRSETCGVISGMSTSTETLYRTYLDGLPQQKKAPARAGALGC